MSEDLDVDTDDFIANEEDDDFEDVSDTYDESDIESNATDDDDDDSMSKSNPKKGPKKSSRKRRNLSDFILHEVEEVSAEEEEDDDELDAEEGFAEMEKRIREREKMNIYNKRRISRLDYAIRDADQDQLEELAKRWTETTSHDDEHEGIIPVAEQPGTIHKKRLLPTIKDPSLWMVRCQIGQEANAVLALMRKSIYLMKKANPLNILSAVYQNGIKGFIYVEAYKQSYVKSAIEGLSYFTFGINKQKMVPLIEMPHVLKVVKEAVVIEPDSWIRVKRGEYRNDLGLVDSVDKVKNSVIVKLIPRIDYRSINRNDNNDHKDNEKKIFRPEASLFNIDKIRREGGILTQDHSGFYQFNGNRYKDGFLYKRFPIKALMITGIEPKLNELEKFNVASKNEALTNNFTVTLNKTTSTNPNVPCINETHSTSNVSPFIVNDLVQIKNGELSNMIGHIVSIDGESIKVKLVDCDDKNNEKTVIQLTVDALKKYFTIGDPVAVISGEHQGQTGMVVRVEDPYVIVFSSDSFLEMKVFSHNLRKTTNRFSGVDSFGKFQVGEFIRIDSNTVGCITRIQNENVEFLNQMGKYNTSKIHNIQKYTPKKGVFRDKFNNPLTIGDTVRVVGLDSYKDVVGQIKMLIYEWAFVYSPMVKKDRCMFTCKTRSLVVESNSNNNNNADGGSTSSSFVDLSSRLHGGSSNTLHNTSIPMSPRINSVNNNQRFSTYYGDSNRIRNNTCHNQYTNNKSIKNIRGKSVRIIYGPYKGYYGIVRDCSGQLARIELHTNSKTISVDMSHFTYEGDDRSLGTNNTASPINTPLPYSLKSAQHTPYHSLGSETPGYNPLGGTGGGSQYHFPTTPHFEASMFTPVAHGSATPRTYSVGGMNDYTTDDRHQNNSSLNKFYESDTLTNQKYINQPLSPDNSINRSHPYYSSSAAATSTNFNINFEVKINNSLNKQFHNCIGRIIDKSFNSYTIQLKDTNDIVTINDKKNIILVKPIQYDNVEILCGEHVGKQGTIMDISGHDCTIKIASSNDRTNIRVPLSNVAKLST